MDKEKKVTEDAVVKSRPTKEEQLAFATDLANRVKHTSADIHTYLAELEREMSIKK